MLSINEIPTLVSVNVVAEAGNLGPAIGLTKGL